MGKGHSTWVNFGTRIRQKFWKNITFGTSHFTWCQTIILTHHDAEVNLRCRSLYLGPKLHVWKFCRWISLRQVFLCSRWLPMVHPFPNCPASNFGIRATCPDTWSAINEKIRNIKIILNWVKTELRYKSPSLICVKKIYKSIIFLIMWFKMAES